MKCRMMNHARLCSPFHILPLAATHLLCSAAYHGAAAPDPRGFPPLLRAAPSLATGLSLHQRAVVLGLISDPFISSSLLSMYSRLGDLHSSRKVFDLMPSPNVVPWSAIIAAYSRLGGDVGAAFTLCNRMRGEGVDPNSVTVLGLLSGVEEIEHLVCVHGWVIRGGLDVDLVVANCLVNVYSRFGRVESARRVFDEMPVKDIVSWNSMISGYVAVAGVKEAAALLTRMRSERMVPDHHTLGSLVASVVNPANDRRSCRLGKQIHAQAIACRFDQDVHVQTNLLSMYLKCRDVEAAYLLFQRFMHRDAISWTAMTSGLVQNGRAKEALVVFGDMLSSGLKPLPTTIASALSATAQLDLFNFGTAIHGYVIRQQIGLDRAAANSLVSMYAKCSHLRECQYVFGEIKDKDVVSWNAIISAYSQNGDLERTFAHFNRMRLSSIRPDSITIVAVLQICASLGILHHGKCVHGVMFRSEVPAAVTIVTSLINMYSKCGDLVNSRKCFDASIDHDLISWNAMIEAYGSHGIGLSAHDVFLEFLQTGIEPNPVMFLSVLAACSHSGLVQNGVELFRSMIEEYKLEPSIEHYACITDLLGRAGRIEEAWRIIKAMPEKPNADILGILLDACKAQKNADIGLEVARKITELQPENAGSFVQLAQIYAATNKWDRVQDTWRHMRSLGLRKAPACSSIELNGAITTFYADHTSHTKLEVMNILLSTLDWEMRKLKPAESAGLFI